MKKLLILITLSSAICCLASTNQFPILHGLLQGDLDAAGYRITNANSVAAASFSGDKML